MTRWKTILVAAGIAVFAGSANAEDAAKLIFATVSPPGNALNVKVLLPWAKRIEGYGNGGVAVDVREGTALANYGNVRDRVMNDVIQIGFSLQDAVGGVYPRSEVGGLPGLFKTSEDGAVAMWRLYKSGVLDAEYAEIVPFAISPFGGSSPHMAKPMVTPDDFSGLKLMVAGKLQGEILSRLGGAPLAILWNDMYESLNRRTIDGAVTGWTSVGGLKLDEVTTYHVDAPFGTSVGMIFMAKKKYDALPETARKALDMNKGEEESRGIAAYATSTAAAARAVVQAQAKQTIVTLTPEQDARWKQKIAPVIDGWAQQHPDGQKVLAAYRQIIAQIDTGR
jgi:TRAP-type C4-dicarboxylate transport system substrate-binding protein